MTICVGLAADDTFCHTLAALRRAGIDFDVLDFAQMAFSCDVNIRLDDPSFAIFSIHGYDYVINKYDTAYIRIIDIAEGAPSERLRRRSEGLYIALNQMFGHAKIRVMNPPLRDCSNFSKLYHSVVLSSIAGWAIPRSCLTNNPDRALEFISSCYDGAIFKGSSGVKTWATLYDPGLHAGRLKLLNSCPVLFQERISGPDVRVHVVGDRLFAESIESTGADYRLSRTNIYRQIETPAEIARGCLNLARDCGTPLLGIDFKIQQCTGVWFALEANSMPCYEGYDRRAGGAISEAVAEWLS